MDCPDKAWVGLFVRGEASAEDVSRFEVHLDSCGRCLGVVGEMAKGAAASYRDTVPDGPERDSLWVHLLAAFARVPERWEDGELGERRTRERFGSYRVLGEIGRGAMGVVYSAVDERSSEPAAIKTVAEPKARSLSALRKEISFLRRAQHPGVVRILDDGVVDGEPWYAME